MTQTYEQLVAQAKATSLTCGYGAVVEVVNYRSGTRRATTAGGSSPLKTVSRSCEFRGVLCQFYKGRPYEAGRPLGK